MREIKFRAWVPDWDGEGTGRMFTRIRPVDADFEMFEVALNPAVGAFDGDFTGTVEQYTGLKDKNGLEIYEGDIVKGLTDYEEDIFAIEWLWEKHYSGWEIGIYSENDCEVIGNIHENPELLK